MDMNRRNKMIDKIKALLSKTTANGCTEAEMLSALDMAAAMRDAYDISDDELQFSKDEAAMEHSDPPDTPDDSHGIKWRLGNAVSEFCNVQIYRSRDAGFKCIGLPSDVQFAVWLLDTLADFVYGELYAHLIGSLAPPKEKRTIIRSFVDAACARISERMLELVERSKRARNSNGRELVLVKDAAIKEYMKENGIKLRASCIRDPSNYNEAARAAGRAAGDRAAFGRPVSGAAGVLRLR